jgi:FeS assembly SUF system protein
VSDERKHISLNQAPVPNAKVEEFRRGGKVVRVEGEGMPPEITTADDDGRIVAERILESLQTVYDPELPVNIVDLGLIYAIDIDADYNAKLKMTLTAPGCPVADQIVREVESKMRSTPGVAEAKVELVWSPPWEKSRMSDAALLELGLL